MAKAADVCNVMRTIGVFDAQVDCKPLDLLVSSGTVLAKGISHGAGSSLQGPLMMVVHRY